MKSKRFAGRTVTILSIGALALATACSEHAPPPPLEAPVPNGPAPAGPVYPADVAKPLPDQSASDIPAPSFNDPIIVEQRLPEEAYFVNTYNSVGHPRIAVFVNRTLDGSLVSEGQPVAKLETVKSATGGVEVKHGEGSSYSDFYHGESRNQNDEFKSNGPAEYREKTTVYLRPGQYDEAALQALDYTEMESLLTDWLGATGKVTLLSPNVIRSHLNDDQLKNLQGGKTSGLNDLGQSLQADVLVQFQAHPVRRDNQLIILLVGEAINIRGGESIGQASVEMPTPINRIELNNFTRFLARKMMLGMANTWRGAALTPPPAPAPQLQVTPAPPATTQPVPHALPPAMDPPQ